MQENGLVLRKHTLKYSGVEGHDVRNLFSNGSEKETTCRHTECVCANDKANGAKWVKHEFFVLFLFLQLFYKVEIISK